MKEGFIEQKRLLSFVQENNSSRDLLILKDVSLFEGMLITLNPKYFIHPPEPLPDLGLPQYFLYETWGSLYVNKRAKIQNKSFLDYFKK